MRVFDALIILKTCDPVLLNTVAEVRGVTDMTSAEAQYMAKELLVGDYRYISKTQSPAH